MNIKVEYVNQEESVTVKNVVNFLNKLGLKLKIFRKPNSITETYIVAMENNKEVIFVGNHRSFYRWLLSVKKVYDNLLYCEFLKETDRLN
ncbi:MAG: hypothetical protein PWQ25_456 [Deferribacteres bacterium]|jgi:hypothetical protein|nr:hypothetical protein [Deferribacteres bacterium]